MRAWPSTSSGLVGSSIHHGSKRCERAPSQAIASSTSQTWFASIIRTPSRPIAARMIAARAIVRLDVGADLHLEVREARRARLAHERLDLVVGVAEPARRRRVRRVARRDDRALALGGAVGACVPQQVERLLGREGVRDVAEVDARDELLGGHVGEQLPERLALALRPQVPDRVDDRGRREVDDALLRAEPAELRCRRRGCARSRACRRRSPRASVRRRAARARAPPRRRPRCRARS